MFTHGKAPHTVPHLVKSMALRGPHAKPAPADNVVSGGFPDIAVKVPEPDWLLAFPDGVWEDRAAALAAKKWNEVVAHMAANRTLAPENSSAIEILCVNFARWQLAEAHVRQHGPIIAAKRTKVPQHNPWVEVARAAALMVLKIEAELGIPPSMRARVGKVAGARKARQSEAWLAHNRKA